VRLSVLFAIVVLTSASLAPAQKMVSPPQVTPPSESQLKPPSPRIGGAPQPNQAEGGNPLQSRDAEQRGTEQRPVIVRILPAAKTAAELSQEEQERSDKSSADWWIVRLTAALAVAAILQFLALVGQAIVFGIQARRLRESIDLTRDATARQEQDMQALITAAQGNATAAASLADAAKAQQQIMREQTETMASNLAVTKIAADAAQEGARAATLHATAVVNTQMPIVRLYMLQIRDHITGAVISDGVLPRHFDIYVWFKNFGQTPAFPYRLLVGNQIALTLPPEPIYFIVRQLDPGAVIPADGGTFAAQVESVYIDKEEVLARIESLQLYFWFFQSIEFRDVLENENKWRYCVRWLPFVGKAPNEMRGGFIFDGPPGYRQAGNESLVRNHGGLLSYVAAPKTEG
jgi:hypothetical protein